MDAKKIIGEKIKEARTKKGLTQVELSEKTGLSRSYISDIENGRYLPSILTLLTVANELKIDLNFLNKSDGNTSKGDVNDGNGSMELSK